MKKVICLLLVLVLLFALCGCSKKAPAPTPAAGSEASAPAPAGAFDPDFTFSVTGRDGTVYTEQVFAEHALTVINSWTVWSEPSIAEMATLAKLWENYRDSGLMILSVYPMSATDADIENLQAKTGAGYPFVPYAPAFMDYQSGMFPNSILIDRAGHVVTHTPDPDVLSDLRYHFDRDWADFLGERVYTESMSYEDWEAIVLPYLTK